MQYISIKSRTQLWLVIGMPVLALALSLFVIFPLWGGYRKQAEQVKKQRAALNALQTAPLPPPNPVVSAAIDVPSEPNDFVSTLTSMAVANGCEIAGLEMTRTAEEKAESLVRPVRAKLTLSASYSGLRAFLDQLRRAGRLYVVTELSLDTGPSQSTASLPGRRLNAILTIERYVTPPTELTPLAAG